MARQAKDKPPGGRGALSNRSGRFEASVVEPFDDGWSDAADERARKTRIHEDASRSVIATNESPDVPFDRSINPYRGCEHGCVYCFARPSHAYLGLSPGLDFETEIFAKPDAPELLEHALSRPGYRPETIAIGGSTDAYQPAERELGVTRRLLEVLDACSHPVAIVTKSSLVLRDVDVLQRLAERELAHVLVSVTTLDRELASRMEPRAAAPRERLRTITELRARNVPVGVLASPVIPALNDSEIEAIADAVACAGAGSLGYILLRLPGELKELFEEWLRRHYPLRADHVLSLVRDTRGGALYDSRFGTRMRGDGPYAELISRRFDAARRRHGLAERLPSLDVSRFEPARRRDPQLGLFDRGETGS